MGSHFKEMPIGEELIPVFCLQPFKNKHGLENISIAFQGELFCQLERHWIFVCIDQHIHIRRLVMMEKKKSHYPCHVTEQIDQFFFNLEIPLYSTVVY